MVSSRDVAALAGLSQSTVSRVFRGIGPVNAETARRVRDAATQLNYFPSEAARALVAGRTFQIALVVEALTHPAFARMADMAHRQLLEFDYRLTIVESDVVGGSVGERALQQVRSVDGIIFAASERTTDLRTAFKEIGKPVVFALRSSVTVDVDSVDPDHAAGAEIAVDHLWSLGHRSIALIGATPRVTSGFDVAHGFREAMRRRGVEFPFVVESDIRYDQGREHGLCLLSCQDRPSAIFTADDHTAYGVIDAARNLGLRVPRDVSVVGFDDFEPSAWQSYDLTTVHISHDEIVARAIALLRARIDEQATDGMDRTPPVHEVVPVYLVERGSTAPAPVNASVTEN